MPPTQRRTNTKGSAETTAVPTNKRRGAENADDDDALLVTSNSGRWTDAFVVLRVTRWVISKGLEVSRGASSNGRESQSSSSASSSRPQKKRVTAEKEELPFKEATLQFLNENKIPVGLVVIFILTCMMIIGGESINSRAPERSREAADDYYGVLGVARDADTADVKRAYKTLAKRWHPDRNPNCTTCQETFSKIAVAYETLSDDAKRAAYDESGGVATSELKSPKSVPLTRENFDELVTFSNDVWIVQVFRPDDGGCAQFHPFWENQIQKHGHLVRFGRIDITNDQAKWLPVKIRVLPTVLKFSRHLGRSAEIFPVTAMHETPQALMKFVLTSFPNIGLPLHTDSYGLSNWLGSSTRHHKVLFAIPGRSEEERYKSHLVVRKLAARWSEIFEFRIAETSVMHNLPADAVPLEVKAVLPLKNETADKAAVIFFPATGSLAPRASAILNWPAGEEEFVLQLLRLAEQVGPTLDARSAELLCKSLAIRRVFCLVILDAADSAVSKAVAELKQSREQYVIEVADIRASGGEVSEDEDNFIVPALRLLRQPSGLQASLATCHAPKFPQVEKALDGAGSFLMDLDTGRIAALRGLSSYRGLYPQIAYEDSLAWLDNTLDPILSLPDCNEGILQYFARDMQQAPLWMLFLDLLFALFFAEMLAKALSSSSWRWWLGTCIMLLLPLLRSPPFQRLIVIYLPNFLFTPTLINES